MRKVKVIRESRTRYTIRHRIKGGRGKREREDLGKDI